MEIPFFVGEWKKVIIIPTKRNTSKKYKKLFDGVPNQNSWNKKKVHFKREETKWRDDEKLKELKMGFFP